MSKPTIVFVPGAWHSPIAFQVVAYQLQQAGYPIYYITLPSVGAEPPVTDITPDVSQIRSHLSSLIDSGHEIILVMHSYGGVCGSAAVQDLSNISHLVYLSSFLLAPGVSLRDAAGGQDLPWWGVSEDRTNMFPTTPREIFYNDMSENEAEAAASVLKSQGYGTFTSEAIYAAWTAIPTTYVFCEKDQAIPIEAQRAMVDMAKQGSTLFFGTETLNSSHSPFYSQPDAVVRVIRKAAGENV